VKIEINDESCSNFIDVISRKQIKAHMLLKHCQEMKFPDYVANVGGLAGIYLGLSVFAVIVK
jgi:hypothetical protein